MTAPQGVSVPSGFLEDLKALALTPYNMGEELLGRRAGPCGTCAQGPIISYSIIGVCDGMSFYAGKPGNLGNTAYDDNLLLNSFRENQVGTECKNCIKYKFVSIEL